MAIMNDISLLPAKFQRRIYALHQHMLRAYETNLTKTRFEIFETVREITRQRDLLKKGVTKAPPWESAHQFGLAVDFVPYLSTDEALRLGEQIGERVLPGWSWHSSHDYAFLRKSAEQFSLCVPITWDPCHVQHPRFGELRKVFDQILDD